MKVYDISRTHESGIVRIAATVEWEDRDRPPLRLFFESIGTDEHFWPDPNAFLIACLLPAWKDGESRLQIEGSLCPVLHRGLQVPLRMIPFWSEDKFSEPPTVEATEGYDALPPVRGQSLSLMSCGIDSTATLRWNALHLPPDHPESIRAVLVAVFGDTTCTSEVEFRRRAGVRLESASRIAESVGIEAIAINTNLGDITGKLFFARYWFAAAFSSLASLCSSRFRKLFIPGGREVPDLRLVGSHPLLDPYYSSAHFSVAYDAFEMSRIEKVRLVAGWDEALENLRVCQADDTGATNCGTCEKCIRTMLALESLGRLSSCAAFPRSEIDVDLVWTLDEYDMINKWSQPIWYQEIIDGLRGNGRTDLAIAVESVIRAASDRAAS